MLALLIDVGGVGRVVEHVDGVAVGERIVRRRDVLRGRGGEQQILRGALHPEPAERVAVDDPLGGPQVERREADRQAERERDVVQGIEMSRGHPAREVKEGDDRQMLRAHGRLPPRGHRLGGEHLVEVDPRPWIADRLRQAGHTGVEMGEKLLATEPANLERAGQPAGEPGELPLELGKRVLPGAPLFLDSLLEPQQEVPVDLAGRTVGDGEHRHGLEEGAVPEIGPAPAVVEQPADRLGKVALTRVGRRRPPDGVVVEGPGGRERGEGAAHLAAQGVELLVRRARPVRPLDREGGGERAVLVQDDPLWVPLDQECPGQKVDEPPRRGLVVPQEGHSIPGSEAGEAEGERGPETQDRLPGRRAGIPGAGSGT